MKPESTWTPPHPRCPHPEWWHAPDNDSTEQEVTELAAALVRALQPQLVVETGTAFGYTAKAIGVALERNGHGELHTLEPDPTRREHAELRCGLLLASAGPIHVHATKSLEWNPPGVIGFAWFDSLYELRVDEYLRYRNLGALQAGGIVAFHDSTSADRHHHYDVRADIHQRLVDTGQVAAIEVPTPRGVILAQVL